MSVFLVKNDGYFNVRDTLECGQIFRFSEYQKDCFLVFSEDKSAKIFPQGDFIAIESEEEGYFKNFFDLQTDYSVLAKRLSAEGGIMKTAVEFGKGIRILRQNLEEMIFSFIISANNNIKRIKQIVERICMQKGKRIADGYAFPSAEVLAGCDKGFFEKVGAGYRAQYLVDTAKKLCDDFDFEALQHADTLTARKMLLGLKGVGPKVADCILLFGMHRGDVFPVDTWIKKVYHDNFESGLAEKAIADFFVSKYKDLSGLAQQYLFYYYRNIDKTSFL